MKIAMLSDFETRGGAAVAASRLAAGLVRAGQQVTRIVQSADGQPHAWNTLCLSDTLPDKVARRAGANFWLDASVTFRLRRALSSLAPDFINIHNLHSANWPMALARVCAEYAPVIWSLHDMWSFTGRCAYSDACRKYEVGCDAACPTPAEYPALEPALIAAAWRQRKAVLADAPAMVAVTDSHWLAAAAKQGLWRNHRVEAIPNGVPLDVYRLMQRAEARQQLGLNPQGIALLVAAQRLDNRHKGVALLAEALRHVRHRPLTLMIQGHGEFSVEDSSIEVVPLGFIADEARRVLVYNAVDALVHPAINDNSPLVVLEAMACGTPVIAFPIGGVPELVRPGKTGWLADAVSSAALAQTIDLAAADLANGSDFRATCRTCVEAEYSDVSHAQAYCDLMQSVRKTAADNQR